MGRGRMSDIEESLKRITSHNGVMGVAVLDDAGKLARYSLPQEMAEKYGEQIFMLQQIARTAVRDVDPRGPDIPAHRHQEIRNLGGAILGGSQVRRDWCHEGQGLHPLCPPAQAGPKRLMQTARQGFRYTSRRAKDLSPRIGRGREKATVDGISYATHSPAYFRPG